MPQDIKSIRFAVELDNGECQLILDNAMVFGKIQKSLEKAAAKEGSHKIMMTLIEIQEIAGWLAAEANHANNKEKEIALDELYSYFEGLEYDGKRRE